MAQNRVIPAECGPEELGRLLNLSVSHLRNLAREGVIPKPQRGLYQVFGSVQGVMNALRKEDKEGSYTAARARMTLVKADVAELQRGKLTGELVPANEILAAVTAAYAITKRHLLAIPSKSAPRLVLAKTASEAKNIVERDIREALEALELAEIVHREPKANGKSARPVQSQ